MISKNLLRDATKFSSVYPGIGDPRRPHATLYLYVQVSREFYDEPFLSKHSKRFSNFRKVHTVSVYQVVNEGQRQDHLGFKSFRRRRNIR